MTLMAGPIDTRVNPTRVNALANSRPIEWFEQNLIATVPLRYPGAFRRVYPGFVQLAAFMSMKSLERARSVRARVRSLIGRSGPNFAIQGGEAAGQWEAAVPVRTIEADPTAVAADTGRTALLIIDMQRDFLEPGGFGAALGNDVSRLKAAVQPCAAVLAAARQAGIIVIHAREGHRPDLTDAPPMKVERGDPALRIGAPGPMGRILVPRRGPEDDQSARRHLRLGIRCGASDRGTLYVMPAT